MLSKEPPKKKKKICRPLPDKDGTREALDFALEWLSLMKFEYIQCVNCNWVSDIESLDFVYCSKCEAPICKECFDNDIDEDAIIMCNDCET